MPEALIDTDLELPPAFSFEVFCDMGRHTNLQEPPCPFQADWRVCYICCGAGSLLCTPHKDLFMRMIEPYLAEIIPRKCPYCHVFNRAIDILRVEHL